jgi:hypothetical protein
MVTPIDRRHAHERRRPALLWNWHLHHQRRRGVLVRPEVGWGEDVFSARDGGQRRCAAF